MKRRIQIGIIGAGKNTTTVHIPRFLDIPNVQVVAVCNRSRESGDDVADRLGIPQVYTDWRELLRDEAIDAILIGTWPYTHCEMTCEALAAGKHVLCEARMAMNAEQAHRMLRASREHPDLVAQLVPSPFTLELDGTIRRLLHEDRYVGGLFFVDIYGASGGFADLDGPLTWRQDAALSGLNTLAMGIWYEALARWVGHAARVMASSRVHVNQRRDVEGRMQAITVPDHVDVLADLACGARARLQCSDVTGHSPSPWSAYFYGRDGTLRLDARDNALCGARRGEEQFSEIVPLESERRSWRVEEEFVGAIRGTETVKLTTFEDGVRYMEFTEAVAVSSREGRAVSLPLDRGR